MVEGKYYEKLDYKRVRCRLCPHNCVLRPGDYGLCKSRTNKNGKLYSTIYGKIVAIHLDPIEKKPLKHFYPGTNILSIGTCGCNFHCKFCQNYELSQNYIDRLNSEYILEYDPKSIVNLAVKTDNNLGIAFTYNEPGIWFEYVLEVSKLAKEHGLKVVMVTNGYLNREPLMELNKYVDAYSIDIKSYNNDFYKKLAGGSVTPILKNTEYLIKSKKHVEIDYLVIPTYNDDYKKFEEFMCYYKKSFGEEVPLHINRYFPQYKLRIPPTPKETLYKMKEIAQKYIKYVYLGNI